jgi:type II secretory pathway component GspD/PulD (secretin)
MSELLEVFRREAEKFREFREAMRGLRREVDRSWGLEAEISELMKRAREDELRPLWHALLEIMTGEDPSGRPRIEVGQVLRERVIEGPNPLGILRGMRKRAALLREAIGLAEGLELPEPYPIKLKYIKPSKFKEMISGIGLVPAEKIQTDDEKDLVIVMTTKQTISAIRKLVEEVDIPPKRVTVEAKIIEVSADSLKDLGISWSDSVSLSLELSPSPELPIPTKVATARLSAISTSLNLLERQGKARTLENSRMTVLSNQTANILGGEKIPIVTRMPIGFPTGGVVGGIPTAPGYVTETLQIQYVEVGIKLTVTPRVNEEDVITMDIKPEVSTVAGWRGPNNDIPIVKTREARTTVWVRDGDTILLGGLTSEEKRTTTTKTPILGDLPIIGRLLFTRKREDTMKTELIIMIVPQILREKGS